MENICTKNAKPVIHNYFRMNLQGEEINEEHKENGLNNESKQIKVPNAISQKEGFIYLF